MKILVTGGAGFIGSHLVERLLSEGDTVTCVDNLDDFYDETIKLENIRPCMSNEGFRFYRTDIRDVDRLEECFKPNMVDVVVHLAARAGVRPSVLCPASYYDVNVMGTIRVLETMRKHNVSRMVFASSSSVYGNSQKVPFSETDPVDHPISPYAASKRAAELLCHTYHHLHDFDIHCLRLFTVYGPRQRPEMAIYRFTESILRGAPIAIYGNGNVLRDFTYIRDIVDGIVKSIRQVRGYQIVNLGNANPISLTDLVSMIENALGKKALIQWRDMQEGDAQITFADIKKASELLGFLPKVNTETGIREFVEWYLESRRS